MRTSNSKVGTVADNPLSTGRNIDTMPSKDFNSTTATFEIPTNIITIGRANTGHVSTSNYFIGGTTANTEYDRLATIEDSYVGATIKVTIPEIRYMIGDDTTGPDAQGSPNGITADSGEYHIALEHPSDDGRNETTGRIVLEANDGASPTSSNLESSMSSTTSTRTIVGHTTQ